MKRPLIWLVTAVAMLLVSSCGAEGSSASTATSEPQYKVLDKFEYQHYTIEIICRGNDMYVVTRVHYGVDVERLDNHEECK